MKTLVLCEGQHDRIFISELVKVVDSNILAIYDDFRTVSQSSKCRPFSRCKQSRNVKLFLENQNQFRGATLFVESLSGKGNVLSKVKFLEHALNDMSLVSSDLHMLVLLDKETDKLDLMINQMIKKDTEGNGSISFEELSEGIDGKYFHCAGEGVSGITYSVFILKGKLEDYLQGIKANKKEEYLREECERLARSNSIWVLELREKLKTLIDSRNELN